jgi:DNA repair exonuclease SbcCD ATPase subunit
LRVVHNRLGQVGNDLAVCNQVLSERPTKRKRRHSSSTDTRSSSSSSSSSRTSRTSMPNNEEEEAELIKFFTSEIKRLTGKLAIISRERDSVQEELTNERKWRQKEEDLAQAAFDNKLEAVSKERDTAQAELKNERKRRQNCSKKREDQLKMFTKLLIEFGADQELLLSLGASCKNYNSHESDESQNYVRFFLILFAFAIVHC